MRRKWLVSLGIAALLLGGLWTAAPRLMDRYAPTWKVVAKIALTPDAAEVVGAAVDCCCLDVIGSERIVTDWKRGR